MAGMMRLIWKVKEKMKYNRKGKSNHDKRFHRSAKPRKSAKPSKSVKPSEYLAVNGDGLSGITLEGEETDFLDWVHNFTD